jgi:hypothetical protein
MIHIACSIDEGQSAFRGAAGTERQDWAIARVNN